MSRLDAFIRRMQAQRACIDDVAARTANLLGPVLELGLGNGRTYDHLRERFPGRDIYVFDREVAAHPDSIPAPAFMRLGDFRSSLAAFAKEGKPAAAFVHADIGSSNKDASVRLAADLAPTILRLLVPGGFLGCDQPIELAGLLRLPMPDGSLDSVYHFYQRAS